MQMLLNQGMKILSLSATKNNVCWSFPTTSLTCCLQKRTPFCWWESGIAMCCFWEFPTTLRGICLPSAPAVPLLEMYPRDTLSNVRVVMKLFITRMWTSETGEWLRWLSVGTQGWSCWWCGATPPSEGRRGVCCVSGDRKWQVEKTNWSKEL